MLRSRLDIRACIIGWITGAALSALTAVGYGQNLASGYVYGIRSVRQAFEGDFSAMDSAVLTLDNPFRQEPQGNPPQLHYIDHTEVRVSLIFNASLRADVDSNYWQYTVHYKLIEYPSQQIIDTGALQVGVDERCAYYEHMDTFRVSGDIDSVRLVITAIDDSTAAGSTLPDDIELRLMLYNHRIHYFNAAHKPYLEVNVQGDKAHLHWSLIEGAHRYEVEILHIDLYEPDPPPNEAIFRERATRIATDRNFLVWDLTYPAGKVFFRVRAVGYYIRNISDGDYSRLKYGAYSNPRYVGVANYDAGMHWQEQAQFTERGQWQKQMQYYDHALRLQQRITSQNSKGHCIVEERDYDAEGRPALQILPVPDLDRGIDFSYRSYFNTNNAGQNYSYLDFDDGTADPLSISSGAGKYYSPNNTADEVMNDYLPNAHAKPFVHTRYTNDPTNRVVAQSMPGAFYQIGSGHETRYYYLTATEAELKRLFRDEIGDASHYKKTVTVDPNGQASVRFTDLAGRTVATALIGEPPSNLQPLDDIDQQLIKTALNTGTLNRYDLTIESVNTLFAEHPNANFTFHYDLKGVLL